MEKVTLIPARELSPTKKVNSEEARTALKVVPREMGVVDAAKTGKDVECRRLFPTDTHTENHEEQLFPSLFPCAFLSAHPQDEAPHMGHGWVLSVPAPLHSHCNITLDLLSSVFRARI